jgi:hypothetical protein
MAQTPNQCKRIRRCSAAEVLEELLQSYYLSGARKKVDLRKLPGFSEAAGRLIAEARTFLHYDRLHTLWQGVCGSARDLPIVEIGAYQGGSAKLIAEAMRYGRRGECLFVCDTFSGHACVNEHLDKKHKVGRQFLDTSAEGVRDYLRGYPNVNIVIGDFAETSQQLSDIAAFAFVHIDVDVHPTTPLCLHFFSERLAEGASIVVDDYGFRTCPGVKKAVDDFIAARTDFRLLHLTTGQGVLFKRG